MSFIDRFAFKKEKPRQKSEEIPESVNFKRIAERYQQPQNFVQGLQYELEKSQKSFAKDFATRIDLQGSKSWGSYRKSTSEINRLLAEYAKSADVQVYEALEAEIEKMNASVRDLRKSLIVPDNKATSDGWEKEDRVGKGHVIEPVQKIDTQSEIDSWQREDKLGKGSIITDDVPPDNKGNFEDPLADDKLGKGHVIEPVEDDLTYAERRDLLRKAMEGLNPANPVPRSASPYSEEPLELSKKQIIPQAGTPTNEEKPPDTTDQEPSVEKNTLATESALSEADKGEEKGGNTKEVAPLEREALTRAEEEYLSAYTAFHKNKKIWNIAPPKGVKKLEIEYTAARIAYANALDSTLESRLKDKLARRGINGSLERETATGFKNDRLEKTRERYNRLVRFNEVIKPAAQKKLEARTNALEDKDKGLFLKTLSWSAEKNRALEETFGKNGARAIRAATSTLLLAPVAFTGVGAAALAGWAGLRVGRSIASSLAGASLGAAAGAWYEKTRGKRKQAEAKEDLSSLVEDARTMSLTSVDDLLDFERSQEKLTFRASEGYLTTKKAIIQALTALGVGAGTATALSQWESLHTLTTSEPSQDALQIQQDVPQKEMILPVSEPVSSAVGAAKEGIPSAPLESTPTGPIHIEVSRGEGADKLLSDLQERLRAQYPDSKSAPENIQALLNHSPHQTAELLGLGHESGGVMLHPGDTLGVDEQGRLVFHDNIHDRNRIIIDEKHELHPLKGHTAQAHGAHAHKAQVTHDTRSHVRAHTEKFDAKADSEAVAAANRAELAREQGGQFGSVNPVEATVATAPVESIGGATLTDQTDIQNLGDFQPVPEVSSGTVETLPATAPASPEAPNTPTSETSSGASDRIRQLGDFRDGPASVVPSEMLNQHGIEIDTKIPHVYVTENNHIDVFGGKGNAPRLIAEQYARAHPDVLVRFKAWAPDALGNPVAYVGEVLSNAEGEISMHIPNSETEELLTVPDASTFTKVIS